MQIQTIVDVDQYWRDGYLTAPGVLSTQQLAELRAEADRLVRLCSAEPERYARRIEWEVDHLAEEHRRGMDKVIRKLEPVSDLRAQALGEKPLDGWVFERAAGEHEQLLDILRSMERDERRVFSVNLPNNGAIPNLPAEAILELPAAATATGLRPLQMLDFPAPLAAIVIRKLSAAALTVEAALTGSPKLLVEALLTDGAVTDHKIASQMADELLEAHRQYLPNFF